MHSFKQDKHFLIVKQKLSPSYILDRFQIFATALNIWWTANKKAVTLNIMKHFPHTTKFWIAL